MRIRSHLLLLAAVVLVPGFLAASIAVEKVREAERAAALNGLRETVRATALLVDGEIQRSLGALAVLASSPSLKSGDMAAFYAQSKASNLPPDVWTLLLDETGTQVLNTTVPLGTPPPPPAARARVEQVLATQQPLASDVIVGPVTGRLLTTLYVPTEPVDGKRYVVAQAFSVEHWKKKAMQPRGRAEWVVAVLDRSGKFISRSHRTDELLGRSARPELIAAAAAANEGLIRHPTLEGTDSYDAFVHSALTGWTIAIAAPVDTIDASATQAVAWLAAGVAAALAAALLGALMLGRVVMRAIDSASLAAVALGHGELPSTRPTSIDEVDALNDAIAGAGRLLAAERSSRESMEKERLRLLDSETAARQAAQEQNAAKDQFLALLGHELRNPLAAIAGATEVISRSSSAQPAPGRFLAIIQRQTRHLAHVVDDLLEVSRMLSGKIGIEPRPLDLAELVAGCVDALRASERAAAYRIDADLASAWVAGDPVRLEQIVNNLLGNAIKYSPEQSLVRVAVKADGSDAVITVVDTGAGIDAALMPRIFDAFVQGPTLAGRAASGLGIGLALVRQLVALHGGSVEASSGGAGAGSVFTVTLPRIEAPAVAAVAASGAAGVAVPSSTMAALPCRVLLVEDNADARETMAGLMATMGCDVDLAGDGTEALARVQAQRPDIVVMDIGLPGRSGYEIARQLKGSASTCGIPLVALTGYGQERDREAARAAGFDAHLVKPVDAAMLAACLEQQLRLVARQGP